ncbi:MAG: AAA family ATPase [Acidobacteria bacterium]|nr:AAA family ATPase [Acidobacteriota bacterium]
MNLTIPIYIEQLPQEGQPTPIYSVRPLFFQEPVGRDEEYQRAIAKFAKAMKRELDGEGRNMRHNGLAAYSFAPEIDEQLLSLTLELKTRTVHCKFLFITLSSFDRRIAFTPSLPHIWFEIERGEDLSARAAEALTSYFRGKEKAVSELTPRPEDVSVHNKAWASTVEIEIQLPLLAKTPKEEFRAMLGGDETMDGEWELQQVGRCLDWLYPNELNRVIAREKELEELTRLLRSMDRRPVILVGPRMVGKTAIIEEYVYRTVARQKSKFRSRNNVWLIAPQRLISGMSYVGQWENRLLAIIDQAKKRNHVLYFDDLLGLFKAGISRDSNLNAAQVLKPYLERRELRVLGEITPEAWRVLREQDRGFADLFQLLPINEPDEDTTLEMLLGLIRELEHQHHCRFTLDALPAALDLQRRYVRDAAFPGKAAAFLRQLAVKYRGDQVDRESALSEFQAKNGLALWFIGNNILQRSNVIEDLQQEVVGQTAATEAVTDAICVAKARLNDPDRPLATFLFLGPTGVGKTQCAKSLARFLFGDAERLIRFDMNEFLTPGSVSRMVGTFDQPEGLLTNAVRRQPFSVVLLDEIEKAHRDMFNLLLQVMGDGRLTDALGRTADFTNVILIMTSNLGVKEAGSELGFSSQRVNEASIYTQAAEKFFSPEFFNRLDRIVPFERLNRDAVQQIAGLLILQLFQREGLARRKCALHVDNRALERIIDAGFHPQLGARALKRAIENELAQPVAKYLASFQPTSPTVINLLPARSGLRVEIQELVEAKPLERSFAPLLNNPQSMLSRIENFINRTEEEISVLRPEGAISLDAVLPQHRRYFSSREQIRNLRRSLDWLRNQIEASLRAATRLTRNYSRQPRRPQDYGHLGHRVRQVWKDLFAAEDMQAYLRELATTSKSAGEGFEHQLTDLLRETALLSTLAHGDDETGYHHALIMIRFPQRSFLLNFLTPMDAYLELFSKQLGMEATLLGGEDNQDHLDQWFVARGWQAVTLAKIEEGTHLFIELDIIEPVQVKVLALDPQADPRSKVEEYRRRHGSARDIPATGDETIEAAEDSGLLKFDPVIRINHVLTTQASVDLRSGLTTTNVLLPESMRALLLSALPLPHELID